MYNNKVVDVELGITSFGHGRLVSDKLATYSGTHHYTTHLKELGPVQQHYSFTEWLICAVLLVHAWLH